jgi:triosephosphate isomerase
MAKTRIQTKIDVKIKNASKTKSVSKIKTKTSSKMKRYLIGNWKMNPQQPADAKQIFSGIRKVALGLSRVTTVICPPFPYLADMVKLAGAVGNDNQRLNNQRLFVGAQNVFYEDAGAFTGEVSSAILKNIGASYVIVGHSERRGMGETNEIINKKLLRSIANGLTVVLCIGEKSRDHGGEYLDYIKTELKVCLAGLEKHDLRKIIVAYEPIWAIGKSDADAMSPRDIHEMSIYVRKVLSDIFDQTLAARVPVLYGGSVTSRISEAIFREGQIDGLLVGRASLDVVDFGIILRQADQV